MVLIYPQGRDTIFNAFNDSVEIIPPAEDVRIVLYDEQHPKKGRTQKFRLTLLDGVTDQPIAEELYDSKGPVKERAKKDYRACLKKQMALFRAFVHERELERRRKKRILEQRPYIAALRVFDELMEEIESFEKHVQKR